MNTTVPTEYRIHAHASRTGPAAIAVGATHIDLDARWGGPTSGLPGPAELLASAFAACLLKNLARAGDLLGFDYEAAELDVVARRQDSPPAFVEIGYELRVATDEPQRRLDLVHANLRKYGTVYNTLASACDVHGELVAVSRGGLT